MFSTLSITSSAARTPELSNVAFPPHMESLSPGQVGSTNPLIDLTSRPSTTRFPTNFSYSASNDSLEISVSNRIKVRVATRDRPRKGGEK